VQHLAGKESRQDKNGFQTVGMQLRKSITELMEKVLSCEVHFVRCIKPNRHQAPDEFNPDLVLTQLRSLAVVETVHIRNLGFPVWFTFDTFIQRFGVVISLLPNVPIKDKQQTCLKMLRQLVDDPRGWKMGKTKVFLSYWCVERLNAFLERMGAVAVVIQRGFRGWQARKLYSRLKRLKVDQENAVTAFLDTIGKRSEVMLQHISNQVMEEDAKQKLKVNEMASLQRQPRSPNVFNQKSPAASSQQTSFDFKDTPDGFPPLSPRRTSLQQRMSDLSVSSLSDALSSGTPSRPGPPQSRMSDLSVTSVTSVGSTFSVESDEFDTVAPQVWCKITCFEREHPRGEFSIDRPSIVIDGSNNSFDVTRIGLGTLPPSSDSKVTKVRACIGKGMEIVNDEEGNVWATRGSKNAIFVKGHFLSDEVISLKGALEKDSTLKVFDWEAFADSVRYHCLHSKNFDPTIENMVLSSASIFFSFVKDGKDDVSTPCWIQLDVLSALQQGKAACKYAREKRQQEKQQVINSLPPILRPKTRKSRELAAVAHFQQKVRPRRYVDTFKFNRKKWARKEVAMNPFLYGKGKELSQGRRQKPLKAQPAKSNSDPEETLDGAPPGPESLMHLFGSNSDARDGGASQALTSNGSFVVSDLDSSFQANGFQYHEAKREVTSTSVVKKPVKKVWAKKRFADNKAEKGRKRS